MVTYATLNNYREKCESFLGELVQARDDAFAEIQATEERRVGLRKRVTLVAR